MTPRVLPRFFFTRIVSRAGAWIVLAATVAVSAGVMSVIGSTNAPGGVGALPDEAESAQVEQAQKQFPGGDQAPVIAVFTRDGQSLDDADMDAAASVAQALGKDVDTTPGDPVLSDDHKAAVVPIPVYTDRPDAELHDAIDQLRDTAGAESPDDMRVDITGGPAFGADIAAAFDGANFTLLAVTVGIVAVLLLITYRSPILWLAPIAVVGLADGLAGSVTGKLGEAFNLQFDAGIISVLVFGAGANYALLLISRYREELRADPDHRTALSRAATGTAPAILASNITVVLSLLTLTLAVIPSTRGIGIAAAAGLVIVLAFALIALPSLLAVCGRRIFWPFIPRAGRPVDPHRGFWAGLARRDTAKPTLTIGVSVLVLAVLAMGLIGTRVGLSQDEQFRVTSESQQGLQTLGEHFPSGEAEPMTVIADKRHTKDVVQAASRVPGVESATPGENSDNGLVQVSVVGKSAPQTDASDQTVRDVRTAVHDIDGAHAKVGGQTAENVDIQDQSRSDLLLVAPVILGIVLVILMILLRAIAAPVILAVVNAASAVAAIGAGTWLGKTLFGFPALDVNVPLLAFLFLVALGIDYTIFIAHRAQHEAKELGTRAGMVRAISTTGAVITSAGIVLAGVFAALGVLPLVTLGQLGLIVGVGVLIDTLFVRTVLVPAIFAAGGDRIWWPRHPGSTS